MTWRGPNPLVSPLELFPKAITTGAIRTISLPVVGVSSVNPHTTHLVRIRFLQIIRSHSRPFVPDVLVFVEEIDVNAVGVQRPKPLS